MGWGGGGVAGGVTQVHIFFDHRRVGMITPKQQNIVVIIKTIFSEKSGGYSSRTSPPSSHVRPTSTSQKTLPSGHRKPVYRFWMKLIS